MEQQEKEIDCAEVLSKIIFLYLKEVAIPFFRQDKLGVYNGAINLYASKQINNCTSIAKFYERVIGLNQIESATAYGNVTILDEKSYVKNQFVGKFDRSSRAVESESESDDPRPGEGGLAKHSMQRQRTITDADSFQSSYLLHPNPPRARLTAGDASEQIIQRQATSMIPSPSAGRPRLDVNQPNQS